MSIIRIASTGILCHESEVVSAVPVATLTSSTSLVRDLSLDLKVNEMTNLSIEYHLNISADLYNTLSDFGYGDKLYVSELEEEEVEEEEEEEEVKPRGRRGKKAPEPVEEPVEEEAQEPKYFFVVPLTSAELNGETRLVDMEEYAEAFDRSETEDGNKLEASIARYQSMVKEYLATETTINEDDDFGDLGPTARQSAHDAGIEAGNAAKEELRNRIDKRLTSIENYVLGPQDAEGETISLTEAIEIMRSSVTDEDFAKFQADLPGMLDSVIVVL